MSFTWRLTQMIKVFIFTHRLKEIQKVKSIEQRDINLGQLLCMVSVL